MHVSLQVISEVDAMLDVMCLELDFYEKHGMFYEAIC